VALVTELLSRTAVQQEPSQGALSFRLARQKEAAASGQEKKV
jgi:hypothetical protein